MTGEPRSLIRGDAPIALLLVGSFGLWVLGEWLLAGPEAEFFPYGLAGVAWYVLGLLVIAWVASRTSVPPVPFRQSLFLLAACAPVVVGLLYAMAVAGSPAVGQALLLAIGVFGALVLAWGLRRASGRSQLPAVWLCFTTAFGFAWASDQLFVRPTAWYGPRDEDSGLSVARWAAEARLLFAQPAKIDAAVEDLSPREPGRPNAFFVGFAGFGSQKVFAEEVALAEQVIGGRFGATDHSLRLVNDRRDLGSLPLATPMGLRRALSRVASRMDVAEDVLFLVLSSHGAPGGVVNVENGTLPLGQLTTDKLAAALRESGIRWKVVIVSACYSGAFLDTLRDEDTIVLTAAARDRTSFGCDDTRDLTYFGEALFRDALPGAPTLRAAFERVRVDIARREAAEGVEASLPQGWFGAAAEARVASLGR